ncbi:MAG: Fatty acid-binding protein [Firmicutes bacterium ADurb.Bin356]|nr:MAG: Fatty acid-binding protein [Firmicutes bacterium ADurb.Bin356]
MQKRFVITTESNSEVPFEWEDRTGVSVLRMPYTLNGTEYFYDLGRNTDISAFFQAMREGATVITSQRNPNEIVEYFEPFLMQGLDILHIGFSSALSGTFNCEVIAAKELMEKYPERRIELVDSLSISAPLALLIEEATKMQEQGAELDEIRDWVEENKLRVCALFTVDSLEYLKRGGRVSGAAAFFGSVLEIKPVLYVDSEGRLVPLEKVKGRKRAIKYILEKCAATIKDPQNQTVVIWQADCMDEAIALSEQVKALINPKEVRIEPVGPVIGSHAGPGTLSIAYFGRDRSEISAQ